MVETTQSAQDLKKVWDESIDTIDSDERIKNEHKKDLKDIMNIMRDITCTIGKNNQITNNDTKEIIKEKQII